MPFGLADVAAFLAATKALPVLRRTAFAALCVGGVKLGLLIGGQGTATANPVLRAPPPATTTAALIAVTQDLDGDGWPDLARPVAHAVRGIDAYGSGAFGASRDGGRRVHRGVDLVAATGEAVRSPISGMITRTGAAYGGQTSLWFVEITNPETRYRARVLYVNPSVTSGRKVAAGDQIGTAQSLAARYAGITNHVHVEVTGRRGEVIDPGLLLPGLLAGGGRA
jgi:murein DD-endopeptidase MepM/ murein hydrolase activator NlpD